MTRALFAATLLFCLPAAAQDEFPVPLHADWRNVEVAATPYQLRGDVPAGDDFRIGALIYRGGVELASPDRAFGGLSGLLIREDGSRLLAVSDRGQWFDARLHYGADGRLIGAGEGRMAAIVDKDGVVLAGSIADAESLSRSGDGRLFVSFEREHRIDAYRQDEGGLIVFDFRFAEFTDDAPPSNDGVESVTVLDDGVLALSEKPFASGADGYFFGAGGERGAVQYEAEAEYAVTEAARLDDLLFVLERAYSPLKGVRARLLRAPLPSGEARTIKPELLAPLSFPVVVDNMEGLDVRRDARGKTLLYVVSDDNHSAQQKTILLMFELAE